MRKTTKVEVEQQEKQQEKQQEIIVKLFAIIEKQQKQLKQLEEVEEVLTKANNSFALHNYIEDILLCKSWLLKDTLTITRKDGINFGLFLNSYYLLNNKEYFFIEEDEEIKNKYSINIDWEKVPDTKKEWLNRNFANIGVNIPINKIDERQLRNEEVEELSALYNQLTGKSLEI